MKTFRYKGLSPDGMSTSGVIRAYDEYEAVAQLRESHTVITKIEQVREPAPARELGGIREKELALLCSQFAILLRAGLPVVRCVELVAAQTRSKYLRRQLEKVAEDMAGGFPMAQSFGKNIPGLPLTFVETLRAGEQSGTLEVCFQRMQQLFERTARTKAKLLSALTYPAIVICVAIAVLTVIMTVAVPMFTELFRDMQVQLPPITRALIALSDFWVQDSWILLVLAAVLAVAWLLLKQSPRGRSLLAELALKYSPFRGLRTMHNCARFADTMSTMLSVGLPIPRALEITAMAMPNFAFGEGVRRVLQSVQQGRSMTESMKKVEYFPAMLTEMTGVGENAGSLEQTLAVAGEYYDNEVQLTSQRLLTLLEPAVTILLALFTALMLLAVYLPLFGMYGAIA